MRSILFEGAGRRWSLTVGLLAGLATLLFTLAPSLDAQDTPTPPAWFYGVDADSYIGAEVKAFDQNGTELPVDENAYDRVSSDGGWSLLVSSSDASMVKLRLVHSSGTLETNPLHVVDATLKQVSIEDFSPVSTTIEVRIIARRADDGRIEFGMRGPDGEDILPRARFFPAEGPGDSNWRRSTLIDFGNGFEGRIIARHVESDGRTEFGFRVAGYEDIFPRARFFPAPPRPTSSNWQRSSAIEIGIPR
jgi:hypothetical protein